MSSQDSRSAIEIIVGAQRSQSDHLGRVVSLDRQLYVLHSKDCIDSLLTRTSDLRQCRFSVDHDAVLDMNLWSDSLDRPVKIVVNEGRVEPSDHDSGAKS